MEFSESTERDVQAEDATREEFQAVERVVAKLVMAMKQANLYPKDHAISREAINELYRSLAEYSKRYGELVLEVGRDGFRYKDHPITTAAGNKDIASRCHRDGIEWLIFAADVVKSELRTFVDIVNKHQIIGDEDEGDIVTSLWEADLQGIQYHSDHAIWRNEPLIDLSRFQVQKRAVSEKDDSSDPQEFSQAKNILDPSTERHLWQLTAEEIELTRQMVHEEENRDHTGDIFDVLLVVLEQQHTKQDVTTALGIIRECFIKALSRGMFRHTALFLRQIHRIREKYAREKNWALEHMDEFLQAISGSRVLSSLQEYFQRTGDSDPDQSEDMRMMLIRLPPESIEALVPMVPSAGPWGDGIRGAIRELAERDIRPLTRLARNAQPEISGEALALLGGVEHEHASTVLWEATRSRDATVRRAAVQGLLEHKIPDCQEVVSFLADPDQGIRRTVFRFLTRRRSPEMEDCIQDSIRQGGFRRRDAAFLHSLYRALGGCGSQRSEEFLRKMLFSGPARLGGLRAVHRRGAATALRFLNSGSAEEILARASKSLWPSVRWAVRRAREQTYGTT